MTSIVPTSVQQPKEIYQKNNKTTFSPLCLCSDSDSLLHLSDVWKSTKQGAKSRSASGRVFDWALLPHLNWAEDVQGKTMFLKITNHCLLTNRLTLNDTYNHKTKSEKMTHEHPTLLVK